MPRNWLRLLCLPNLPKDGFSTPRSFRRGSFWRFALRKEKTSDRCRCGFPCLASSPAPGLDFVRRSCGQMPGLSTCAVTSVWLRNRCWVICSGLSDLLTGGGGNNLPTNQITANANHGPRTVRVVNTKPPCKCRRGPRRWPVRMIGRAILSLCRLAVAHAACGDARRHALVVAAVRHRPGADGSPR